MSSSDTIEHILGIEPEEIHVNRNNPERIVNSDELQNIPIQTVGSMGTSRTKQSDEKFCSECGEIIKSKAEICPKCGVRQSPPLNSRSPQKLTAALFAFFLGGFGFHKFYLGNVLIGIVYLLFSWTFIPAIIAFIEFIILLTMSDSDFEVKYCRN